MKNMLLKWMLGNAGMGLMLLDPNMNIVEINEWILEKAQLKRNDVTGKPVQEVFPEIAERNHLKYLHAAITGQPQVLAGSFHKYFLKLKRDGAETEEWMIQSTTITPMMDGKKISGISIMITDVTERTLNEERISETIRELRESNEKIRLSEALFRTTLYSIGDAVITTDKNGKIRQMNPIAEQLTGWSEAESAGRWLGDVFVIKSEETGLPVESPVTKVLCEGKIVGLANHTLLVTKQGDEIPIADSGAPIIDATGEITGVVLVFHDQIKEREFLRSIAASEAKFRSLVESSNDGISLMDIEGNILFANQGKIDMLGYDSPVDLIGVNAYSLIEEAERQKFFELTPKFLEQGFLANTETRAIRKDCSVVDVEINLRMINDENGKPAFIMDTIRDISERKKAEEELRIKNKVFDNSIASQSIADTEGIIRYANTSFLKMWGYTTLEQAVGNSVGSFFVNPADAEPVLESLAKYGIWEGEFLAKTCDGKQLISRGFATSLRNAEGVLIGYQSTNLDVTKERENEKQLIEYANKWQATFDGINNSVFLIDINGIVLQANKISQTLFGKKEDEIIGKHCYEVVHNAKYPIESCPIEKLKQTRKRATLQFNVNDKWFDVIVDPIFDEEKNLIGAVHIMNDITEQKQAEAEILRLNKNLERRVIERTAQLEASNKELEAFSYSVSHDLRAPLRHINGFVDLLSNQFKDELPEKAHHYLDTISGASRQMGTLIDELLQYSRTGRQEVRKTQLDMNLLVKEVINQLKTGLEEREINWDIQMLPKVFGDNILLKQVWTNLIDNAVKYTRNQQTAKISVSCREKTKEFVFCVKDNGVGFDMKYAQKLFGVFQRLHSKAEFEGTGIGLANVQRIVHKHLGRVWAEAEPGKGAKFYFSLPINKE